MSARLEHVAFLVRDYDEAIAWFIGKLGFVLVKDEPLAEGKRWVLMSPPGGGVQLLLARAASARQASSVGNQAGGRVFLFLTTTDFEGDYIAMLARGVVFRESPRREAYGSVAVFEDLYGNLWDLLEPVTSMS
jgi:catechol 2,3-dioxygenase-like lactoylglutathione lyase family enzyme